MAAIDSTSSPHPRCGLEVEAASSPRINAAYRRRADELARWVWDHLAHRTDRHGVYANGRAFTSKSPLTLAKLRTHFLGDGERVGLHTTCPTTNTCRFCVLDIDAHEGQGADSALNEQVAIAVADELAEQGWRSLLIDSNGRGGFHLWIVFSQPVDSARVHAFIADVAERARVLLGAQTAPEAFPKQPRIAADACGNYVRVFGLHPKGRHASRFHDGEGWLAGEDAVDYLLAYEPNDPSRLPEPPRTPTVVNVKVTPKRDGYAGSMNGQLRVIDAFNDAHDVAALLLDHGYARTEKDDRLRRPGADHRSEGCVHLLTGNDGRVRSYHHSTSDPLHDGAHALDAFDVYCQLEHGGDLKRAVAALAAEADEADEAALEKGNQERASYFTHPATRAYHAQRGRPVPKSPSGASAKGALVDGTPYEAFPVDALPRVIGDLVSSASAAIGCDPVTVALPALVVAATAIGTSRQLRIKNSWTEFPILWGGLIGASGEKKSVGFDHARYPLELLQAEEDKQYAKAMEDYKAQVLRFKLALREWTQAGGAGDPPAEPEVPQRVHVYTTSPTAEALAAMLEHNPRGVGLIRDELDGWLCSRNEYRSGGKGSDNSAWLEANRGRAAKIDRKGAGSVFVPRFAVWIAGTIQPGVLRRALGGEMGSVESASDVESGLAARLLLACPPPRVIGWSDDDVEESILKAWVEAVKKLWNLGFDELDEHEGAGLPKPVTVRLLPEARELFRAFVDDHAQEQSELGSPALKAAWAKLEAYAARLALVIHLIRQVSSETSAKDVEAEDMEAGIRLARWFGNEARRVYAMLEVRDAKRLAEHRHLDAVEQLVRDLGGSASVNEMCQRRRAYKRDRERAQADLQSLEDAGRGEWIEQLTGGRPTRVLQLLVGRPVNESPAGASAKGAFGDGGAPGGPLEAAGGGATGAFGDAEAAEGGPA